MASGREPAAYRGLVSTIDVRRIRKTARRGPRVIFSPSFAIVSLRKMRDEIGCLCAMRSR